MNELENLLATLEAKSEVDSVFITGSAGVSEATKNSDIDLVIILSQNKTDIRSAFQKIDGIFADIFFFDVEEVKKLLSEKEVNASDFDGMLVSWLQKSDVKFDKSGALTQLIEYASDIKLLISENEKNQRLNNISYDFVRCNRYFDSNDTDYHEALEVCLMNSIVGLLIGFLVLRDEPWKGEKAAIKYVKKHNEDFHILFMNFVNSTSLDYRMEIYTQMVKMVVPESMQLYNYEIPLALSRGDNSHKEIERQNEFWRSLTSLS